MPKTINAKCHEDRSVNTPTTTLPENPPIAVPATYAPTTLPIFPGSNSSFKYDIAIEGKPAILMPSKNLIIKNKLKSFIKDEIIASMEVTTRDTAIILFRPHLFDIIETKRSPKPRATVAKEIEKLEVEGDIPYSLEKTLIRG